MNVSPIFKVVIVFSADVVISVNYILSIANENYKFLSAGLGQVIVWQP